MSFLRPERDLLLGQQGNWQLYTSAMVNLLICARKVCPTSTEHSDDLNTCTAIAGVACALKGQWETTRHGSSEEAHQHAPNAK
eukprot:5465675-Pyramimonas_sp.AAC.1